MNIQVTLAPGQDVGNTDQEFNPSPEVQVFDQQRVREDKDKADSVKVGGIDGSNKHSSTSLIAKTKPLVSKPMARDGANLRLSERLTLLRKPNAPGHFRFNATRFVPKGRKVGSGPLTKPLLGEKKKASIVPKKPKPPAPTVGGKNISLTVTAPTVEASRSERRDDQNRAIMSGTESETNRELPEQPDIGMAGQENDTAPVSSGPTGTVQIQEKKCMNKIKVTHLRLPLKDRGSGCRGDGTVVVENTLGSDQGSSERDGTSSYRESDPDYSPDPLHKLLTDTFDSLNITTFSVHLSKPSNLSVDTETVRKQILSGLKPLSFSSSSPSTSQLSHPSSSQLSAAPPSSMPPSSLSLASFSQTSTSSTIAPSLTSIIPVSSSILPSSSPLPQSSPLSASLSSLSSSNTVKLDSLGLSELDDNSKSPTTVASPKDRKLLPSRESGVPVFRQASPKRGHVRQPLPKFGTFQNKTHPHRSPPRFKVIPIRETENRHTSMNKLPSLPSSSEERRQIPIRRLPPYIRPPFPNVGPFQNQSRPNLRFFTRPSRPLKDRTEIQKEQVSSTELPAILSPPVSKGSYSAEGAKPVGQQKEGGYGTKISMTSMSSELNQTLRGSGMPSSHHPTTRIGYFRHIQRHGGPPKNKTHLSPLQHSHRGLIRKLPSTKTNEGLPITTESPSSQLRNDSIPEILAEQDVPRSTQEVKIRQLGEKETAGVIPSGQIDSNDTAIRPQTSELEKWGDALIQTTKSVVEEAINSDTNFDSDIKKEDGKNTGNANQDRPTIKQSFSDSRTSRPVTLPKKKTPTRTMTAQHHTKLKHYISGSQTREGPKINHTTRRQFDSKTEQTRRTASKPVKRPSVSSAGVVREPLDYVGVTNRTSDGFTLIWDSPEGKYKNFVVTKKEVVKDKEPKQKEGKKDQQGEQEDFERQGGHGKDTGKHQETRGTENKISEDENRLPQSVATHIPRKQSSTTVKPETESDKTLTKVLPGSTRSLQFEDLFPQTEYTVTLLGKGPGLLSRLHKLVISTGTSHWYSRAR